jgi:transposase InsO family protein
VFGRPKYLITDQWSEFMGRVFRQAVARFRIHPHIGTVGRLFATARLERFWRSLKEIGELRLQLPSTIDDLERRLATALTYYLFLQPHQALSGATPAEAFLALGGHDTYGDPPQQGHGKAIASLRSGSSTSTPPPSGCRL